MEQIRTQLERELCKLSDEGWSYILAEVGEQNSFADIKRFVLETDLKKIAEPSIPKDLKKLQNGEITERLVLQITSIVDVSTPKARRERRGLDPHRAHMCVVNFTDGHATLHGVEYEAITDMHTLAAGAKVVIERAVIRGGYLLLDPRTFSAVLFRGHQHDAQLMMRKQGAVSGTQGPPPFTALPLESRVSHATEQRNNSLTDKKGNNTNRQGNDNKPAPHKANNRSDTNNKSANNRSDAANNSHTKQGNNRNNKNNSHANTGNNHSTEEHRGENRNNRRGNTHSGNSHSGNTHSGNTHNKSAGAHNQSEDSTGTTTDNNGRTQRDNTRVTANNRTDNRNNNNNRADNRNNNDNRADNRNNNNNRADNRNNNDNNKNNNRADNNTTNKSHNRSDSTTANNNRNNPRTQNPKQTETNEAKNRSNNTKPNSNSANDGAKSVEYKPRQDTRPVNETRVKQSVAPSDAQRTDHTAGTQHHNSRTNTARPDRAQPGKQQHKPAKYAAKTEPRDRGAGPNKWSHTADRKSDVTDNSAYYQAITPLLQALVAFRPPQHSEAAFMSVQVTLTRVMLTSVTLMSDTLVCLALSDSLTMLQVGCELTLLADILGVTPDNVPLVLQAAYQVIGAASHPVYHLVAPVQINQPMNMIAGYIMLTDIEL